MRIPRNLRAAPRPRRDGTPPGRRRFLRDRRGGVAIWFGISLVALLFFAGSGLDLARSVNQQAQIQGAADAAALAGAGAYTSAATLATATAVATNYMTQFKAMSGLSALTFQVTPGTITSGTTVTVYKMTVTASAPIANTLMAMARSSNVTGATATATNPVYNLSIQLSNFASNAADADSISYYTVPPDGSVPTVTTLMFSNIQTSTGSSAATQITASQKIGFMLVNVTDGKATGTTTCTILQLLLGGCSSSNGYGNNAYGGVPKSQHNFYSHLMPPSKIAYANVSQNCSLQVLTSATAAPVSGSCLSSLPAQATVNCAQTPGTTLYFHWNDMGGSTDDKDYDDAVYTVTCSPAPAGVGRSLALVK